MSLGSQNVRTVSARSLALTPEEYQRQRICRGQHRRRPPPKREGGFPGVKESTRTGFGWWIGDLRREKACDEVERVRRSFRARCSGHGVRAPRGACTRARRRGSAGAPLSRLRDTEGNGRAKARPPPADLDLRLHKAIDERNDDELYHRVTAPALDSR